MSVRAPHSSALSWPSRSACALASTSRRRICSAPRRRAPRPGRAASRAPWSLPARLRRARRRRSSRLPRWRAHLASSIIDCARRSASARRWAASVRADDSSFSMRLLAVAELGLGLVGSRQAFADLGGALVERGGDRRPDLLHREPDQKQEHDQLDDQGGGDAHVDDLGEKTIAVRRACAAGPGESLGQVAPAGRGTGSPSCTRARCRCR